MNPEKRTIKLVKSLGVTVNWQIYSHENRVLLLSSSPNANVIHPYHFKRGTVTRLPKFEVITYAHVYARHAFTTPACAHAHCHESHVHLSPSRTSITPIATGVHLLLSNPHPIGRLCALAVCAFAFAHSMRPFAGVKSVQKVLPPA